MAHVEPGLSVLGLRATYVVESVLGSGAYGPTFAARASDQRRVVLEEVHVGALDDWASLEVCVREAGLLRRLSHPGVVSVVELFAWDGEKASAIDTRQPLPLGRESLGGAPRSASLVVVRDDPGGESLASAIADGHRFESSDLERIFREGLEALRYLQALSPPVAHGDVSPENVVVGERGTALAGVGLVPRESTGVGQDVLQLATTLLFAASHVDAVELERRRARSGFAVASLIPNLEPRLRRALEAALHPDRTRRAASADEVLAILDGQLARPEVLARRLRAIRPRTWKWGAAAMTTCALALTGLAHAGRSSAPMEETAAAPVAASPPAVADESPTAAPQPEAAPAVPECPAAPTCPSATYEPPAPQAPAAPAPPPLVWSAHVVSARGGKPDGACALRVQPTIEDAAVASCVATLTCGDRVLFEERTADTCALSQTVVGEGYARYDVELTAHGEEGTTSVVVDDGRVRYWEHGADGEVLAEATLALDGRSLLTALGPLRPLHFLETSVRQGVVTSASGETTLSPGVGCSLTIEPRPGESNCRGTVRCGREVVYADDGSCEVDSVGHPTIFMDLEPSSVDRSPSLVSQDLGLTIDDLSVSGQYWLEIAWPKPPGPPAIDEE